MEFPRSDPEAIKWLESGAYRPPSVMWKRDLVDLLYDVSPSCLRRDRSGVDCHHGSRHKITKPISEKDLDHWVAWGEWP